MVFSSFDFLLFLGIAYGAFAAAPQSCRWLVLLLASLAFYGMSQISNLAFLGAVTLVTCAVGESIARSRDERVRSLLLSVGLLLLIGSLAVLKFYDAVVAEFGMNSHIVLPRLSLAAPAGFSFYVFSAASYLIDARMRRVEPVGPGHLALYLAFFPKILAGPIERPQRFLQQSNNPAVPSAHAAAAALPLIAWGFFKKLVIADNLSPIVDRNFANPAYASNVELLISVYLFAFQIYCDFSGYSDIAIGLARLFGIRLLPNFRRPYLSTSTAEFWGERWHISLGSWFRDYLYVPLGGSRKGTLCHFLNVMLVFVVSGLWHAGLGYGVGWSFLLWGAINGLYQWAGLAWKMIRERWWSGPRLGAGAKWLVAARILSTFHLIAFGWIFFRASSIGDALTVLAKIAVVIETPSLLMGYRYPPEIVLAAGLVILLLAIEMIDERFDLVRLLRGAAFPVRWAAYYAMIFGLLILGRWQARDFVYMQF